MSSSDRSCTAGSQPDISIAHPRIGLANSEGCASAYGTKVVVSQPPPSLPWRRSTERLSVQTEPRYVCCGMVGQRRINALTDVQADAAAALTLTSQP